MCKTYGCLLLLDIQTILLKKEIEKAYCQYPLLIPTWHDVVLHNNNLLENMSDDRK